MWLVDIGGGISRALNRWRGVAGVIGKTPTASVIVCTRNRAELLEGSLKSILAQRPSDTWELIVVDNASTDETAAVIARLREEAHNLPFHHFVEEHLGLSHARNRAVAAAKGKYLLFTDDDVFVGPGWIDALCAGFSTADVVAVAGRVLPHWPNPPPRWLSGAHTGVLALTDFGDEPRDLIDQELPVGASMAIRASLLDPNVPPFDPRLGHQGNSYFAYEESELFRQLRQRGRLVYRPDAVVMHRILPERMTWKGMRVACIQNGYGSRRAERLRGERRIPLRVSVRGLTHAYASALRQRQRNGARDDVEPEAAFEELYQYWKLGRWIEVVFGRSQLGGWLVRHMA